MEWKGEAIHHQQQKWKKMRVTRPVADKGTDGGDEARPEGLLQLPPRLRQEDLPRLTGHSERQRHLHLPQLDHQVCGSSAEDHVPGRGVLQACEF